MINVEIEVGRRAVASGDPEMEYCTVICVWLNDRYGMPLWAYAEKVKQDVVTQLIGIEDRAYKYFIRQL